MLGRVIGLGVAAIWLASCGGSDGNGSASSASHCEGSGPPPGFDVKVCASIVEDYMVGTAEQCRTCCSTAGFPDAGFTNADHCVCGTATKSSASTACAAKTATEAECSACCEPDTIGYIWGQGVSCDCGPKKDSKVCACALSDAEPDQSCEACCLHHGYLSMMYVGISPRECSCVE